MTDKTYPNTSFINAEVMNALTEVANLFPNESTDNIVAEYKRKSRAVFFSGDSICGGGKTEQMLQAIVEHYIGSYFRGEEPETKLIACKTNKLAIQSSKRIQQKANATVEGMELPVLVVTSEELLGEDTTVTRELRKQIQEFKGIIFCSHKALGLINHNNILEDIHVIVDEVPSEEVAGILSAETANQRMIEFWEHYFNREVYIDEDLYKSDSEVEDPTLWKITLKEDTREELQEYVDQMRTGQETVVSPDMCNIAYYLLHQPEVEVLYRRKMTTSTTKQGESVQIEKFVFEAVDTSRLNSLIKCSKKVTFLSASFSSSLVHFLVTRILGYTVEVDTGLFPEALPTHHTTNLLVYPLSIGANWTRNLRTSKAKAKVKGYDGTQTVEELAMERIFEVLGSDFLLFPNKNVHTPSTIGSWEESHNIITETTHIHGRNDYTRFEKAAYIATMNPSPADLCLLRRYANRYGLDISAKEIQDIVKAERSMEACYQCILRLALRNASYTGQCVVFVPDMAHAEYIQAKFAEGHCTIDTSMALEIETKGTKTKATREKKAVAKKEAKANERLARVMSYFKAVNERPKGVMVKEIQAEFGISKKTAYKWKCDFNAELTAEGLI